MKPDLTPPVLSAPSAKATHWTASILSRKACLYLVLWTLVYEMPDVVSTLAHDQLGALHSGRGHSIGSTTFQSIPSAKLPRQIPARYSSPVQRPMSCAHPDRAGSLSEPYVRLSLVYWATVLSQC